MSRAVHFSMIWEKTPVDLLFKKIDIGDFNNLRPVSTLLHISKLKERAVFAQPNFHSSSSGLHPMHQSAKTQSRSKHVESVTDILMTMNGQYTGAIVMLDPKRSILLNIPFCYHVLARATGYEGRRSKWFTFFLSHRFQRVSLTTKTGSKEDECKNILTLIF